MEKEIFKIGYIDQAEVFDELKIPDKKFDGRQLARKSVGDDKLFNVASIANNTITNAMMADDTIKQAELDYESVNVTVNAGASTGTATITSGSIVIGYYSTGNQDQFVDNVSISGTTLTITLAANATANNTFTVILLKA